LTAQSTTEEVYDMYTHYNCAEAGKLSEAKLSATVYETLPPSWGHPKKINFWLVARISSEQKPTGLHGLCYYDALLGDGSFLRLMTGARNPPRQYTR